MNIYHNPRCKKSRAGLEYLEKKGYSPTIIKYLKDQPFNEESLKKLLMKLNKKPPEIIRTQEKIYKEQFKGKNFNEDEWVKILVENPKLIQRPVIETKHKAVIGDPPKNIDDLI